MTMQPVGDLLDSLGVTLHLNDGDMVPDVVVVAKVVDEHGEVSVGIGISESMSWVDQLGLLTAAADIARRDYTQRDD